MRKAKSPEKRKELEKAPKRKHHRFQIGPNSSPRKVARWLGRGGGTAVFDDEQRARMRAAHVHPRHKRART